MKTDGLKGFIDTPVSGLYMVGPAFAKRLSKLEIFTLRDLIYHLPARYEDFSRIVNTNGLVEGEIVTLRGTVVSLKNEYTRSGFVLQKGIIRDDYGTAEVLWFNQRFLPRVVTPGMPISLAGKVVREKGKLILNSPQFEIGNNNLIHTGRFVPVYPETAGISSKWLRSRIAKILTDLEAGNIDLPETLDDGIRNNMDFPKLSDALFAVHFPKSISEAEKARRRLSFDELVISEIKAQKRRDLWTKKMIADSLEIEKFRKDITGFINSLPFELTSSQKKAAEEIFSDLSKKRPMNRLLQGDVGSGKTIVASLGILAAYFNKKRSLFMAPTEILARQHFETLTKFLGGKGIGIGIATGSKKDWEGKDVIVGTQALLSESIKLPDIGLIIIDEQHRFGVEQRAMLLKKGKNPHLLSMTATPIPRTIALTLYKDLDLSIIDELPKLRKTVKTWLVPPQKRTAAYEWIRKQKARAFIVCPLIEESESLTSVKSAKEEFRKLSAEVFPDLKLGLMHGRLKPKEKDGILSDFRKGKLDILVTTPVVEVGIDIPEATIIVIEAADRFGLAQLHQLRGRVGRGAQQSYCLLFTEATEEGKIRRLKFLESIHNGLKLAETDLKFRGPGQRFGAAQHGRWGLKIADFSDLALLEQASNTVSEARNHPESYPLLSKLAELTKIEAVAPN